MKRINLVETRNINGGAYFGSRVNCSICNKSIKIGYTLGALWRRLLWNKNTFADYYGSLHWNALGSYVKNPHK